MNEVQQSPTLSELLMQARLRDGSPLTYDAMRARMYRANSGALGVHRDEPLRVRLRTAPARILCRDLTQLAQFARDGGESAPLPQAMHGVHLRDSGYSHAQFNTLALRDLAYRLSVRIPQLMRELSATSVAVTGKSGISLAFATLMLCDFPLIVVRKPGENSHGNDVEGTPGTLHSRYILLDDFVGSGATLRRVMHETTKRFSGELACVGVLQYSRSDSGCTDFGERTTRAGVSLFGM